VANTTDPVKGPVREPFGETPAALGLVVLAADKDHQPVPSQSEVLAVSSAVECAHARCDDRSSNLLCSLPSLLYDGRRGVGSEERTPVPLPGGIDALTLEDIEGLIAQVGFGSCSLAPT
jgi:hypothetical protein